MALNVDFGLDATDPTTYLPTVKELVAAAVGLRSPEEQVVSALIIGFAAILSSSVTLGATLLIAIPALFILLPMGILRVLLAHFRG